MALARDGFEVSEGLARSLAEMLVEPDDFKKYPASLAQFSKSGQPYQPGDILDRARCDPADIGVGLRHRCCE